MQQSTIKNMAFFGSIMQKYYPGGRGGDYANEDRNRRRSIKPKVMNSEPNRKEAIDGNLHRRAVTERNLRGKF
jgi:hypothetical protein